ncbi:MAG: DAK2 domain-containing protein [Phototrophicales bacterium]
MITETTTRLCNGYILKWLFEAGLAWLEHHEKTVNAMNVFPVPDGDTGTNMRLTLKKAVDNIRHIDEPHAGKLAMHIKDGALRGARGNSGVILSQLIRGFAETIQDKHAFDSKDFAAACQAAVSCAYQAVASPQEGTILTVAREASEALSAFVNDQPDDLCAALDVLIDAARESLQHTPEKLPVLKKTGVLDSGGQGLVFILEGMSRSIAGMPVILSDNHHDNHQVTEADWRDELQPTDEAGYGYDVQFLMYGQAMDVAAIRADFNAMGWDVLVVGDETLLKVHLHTHDPGEPISYAIAHCDGIDDVVVENMQRQYEQVVQQRVVKIQPVDGVAVIAVANGDGLQKVFYDMGAAHVIAGGQTMNPSTEQFLSVMELLENDEIILLPNNKNIVLTAQQAADSMPNKHVLVIPTTTIPQGISAMLAYMDHRLDDLETLQQAMQDWVTHVISGEITNATRDSETEDGVIVREGDVIGLINGRLMVVATNQADAVCQLLRNIPDLDDHELITLYYGKDAQQPDVLLKTLQDEFSDHEIVLINGGQPLYPYLISVE